MRTRDRKAEALSTVIGITVAVLFVLSLVFYCLAIYPPHPTQSNPK